MSDVIRQARVEVLGLTVVVKQVSDDGDVSYLGKFVSREGPNRFDRAEGVLYGAEVESPDEEDYISPPGSRIEYERFDEAYDEWSACPYEVLASDLGIHHNWGEFRYFSPTNHIPYREDDWSHVEPDVIKNVVEKYGSVERACIAYATGDWYRAESYGEDWVSTGIIVTVYDDAIELGSSSLWGVESDAESYIEEVLEDLLHGAIGDAANNIAGVSASLRAAKTDLRSVQLHPLESEKAIASIMEALDDD